MPEYRRFFHIDPAAFAPFNEAPKYLSGEVRYTLNEVIVQGVAREHLQSWHNLGGRTALLDPHSFAFSVSALASKDLGAYSLGLIGEARINISHFLRSSTTLSERTIGSNFYSGFAFDNSNRRTQTGVSAMWDAIGRHHNLAVQYSAAEGILSCSANGMLIHQIQANLGNFRLELRFEAVGVAGEFAVTFDRLCYYPLDEGGASNIEILRAWDPQFAPVFVSYSHADKERVNLLTQELAKHRVRVLGDWDLRVGDSLQAKLGEFIESAGFVLVFLSKTSVASNWVTRELNLAMVEEGEQARRKKILPILLEECPIPPFLRDKLYLRLEEGNNEVMERILNELRSLSFW
jgi:hypothetical protein